MRRAVRASLLVVMMTVLPTFAVHADPSICPKLLESPGFSISAQWEKFKKIAVEKILKAMAVSRGIPKYVKLIKESQRTGSYRKNYANFGEMGLAEIGISVRYNQANFNALNTGKPLIIVANHPLGIADGLSLQYMAGRARTNAPSILFLARWIEKLLPHAIYGDEFNWGTAIPVEINLPSKQDPDYAAKLADVNKFNSGWTKTSLKVLRAGGAAIVFPAGHVAAVNAGESYPAGVYDSPDSWTDGFLSLARLGKADIVFADINTVNSRAFYRDRKRFGGKDLERIVWFLGEALGKKGKSVDVYLSQPMTIDAAYEMLAAKYGYTREALNANPRLVAELMRQHSRELSKAGPQELDVKDSPQKKTALVDPLSPLPKK